uniref:adenylate cyclase n=1 Tax=Meloidogyne javanica TaxID=6303 RepID=A0A915M8M5_MELJA
MPPCLVLCLCFLLCDIPSFGFGFYCVDTLWTISSVSFPVFLWLIHLPLISEFRVKQERIAELAFSESPILAVIPLFIYQLIVLIVGIICDSNSASSRQAIAQKLIEAIQRRDELEQLKNRQDQLLLSVIPPYLTDKVSKSIFATSSAADFSKQGTTQMKLFHELHVQVHDNVSILFADIVNFTQLAAQLVAKDLVKTLNELYSKFDADAQANFEKYLN